MRSSAAVPQIVIGRGHPSSASRVAESHEAGIRRSVVGRSGLNILHRVDRSARCCRYALCILAVAYQQNRSSCRIASRYWERAMA